MRYNVVNEPGVLHDIAESLPNALHWLAVPFDTEPLPAPFPAPQVRQELIGQRYRRLALLRLTLARRAAIKHAVIDVDVAGSGHALERCAADCARSGPRIERDQDEAR